VRETCNCGSGESFYGDNRKKASQILKEIRRKYPKETPAITYIPKANALIL